MGALLTTKIKTRWRTLCLGVTEMAINGRDGSDGGKVEWQAVCIGNSGGERIWRYLHTSLYRSCYGPSDPLWYMLHTEVTSGLFVDITHFFKSYWISYVSLHEIDTKKYCLKLIKIFKENTWWQQTNDLRHIIHGRLCLYREEVMWCCNLPPPSSTCLIHRKNDCCKK